MASSLGKESSAVIGVHAFTGCDSTSAFCGRGKKRAFTLLKNPQFSSAMSLLGESYVADETVLRECEKSACALYASRT